LHGLCGVWGGVAAGIFGLQVLGGVGGVTLGGQLAGTLIGIVVAFGGGLAIYGAIKALMGLRLSEEEEYAGADLSIHRITAQPDYNRGEV
jgi:Amt family ammonium transporter